MELRKLLKNIKPVAIKGNEDIDVTGVNINSRLIGKGNLFIAMKGTQVDGHRFIGGDSVLRRAFKKAEARGSDRDERKDHHRHLII